MKQYVSAYNVGALQIITTHLYPSVNDDTTYLITDISLEGQPVKTADTLREAAIWCLQLIGPVPVKLELEPHEGGWLIGSFEIIPVARVK